MAFHYITSDNFFVPENSKDYFGLDTETSGLDPIQDDLRLLSISTLQDQYVYDIYTMTSNEYNDINNFLIENKFFIHNALFDVPFLMQVFDFDYLTCVDTMILYQAILRQTYPDSRSTIKYPKSLKALMKVLFNKDISKLEQVSDWSNPNLTKEQIEYAALDAFYVLMIGNKLIKHEAASTKNFKISMKAINALSRIKRNGIYIDTPKLNTLISEWQAKVDESFEKCCEIFHDININSSKQLGEWIENKVDTSKWERTATGKLVTDADAIKAHVKDLPELEPLLTYKKYNKYLSTYGDNIKKFIVGGRLHPSYTLGYTDTGRLSSMQPNIQNFPREQWYRELFIPEPIFFSFMPNFGRTFVCADFSQVEVRVAAILSGEENMLKAYREGKDLYKHTASLLFQKPEQDITKEERQRAKAVVLGLQFGMGAKTLCKYALNYGVNLTEEESDTLVTRYKEAYPKLNLWQIQTTALARETMETKTVCGLKRRLSEDNYYTCSLNTPVQGSAAEVILVALTALDKYIEDNPILEGTKIVATVHDEILVECFINNAVTIKTALENIMHKAFVYVFENIGIKGADHNIVEAHIGKNWAEAK
jgi:DNA polymerase-1